MLPGSLFALVVVERDFAGQLLTTGLFGLGRFGLADRLFMQFLNLSTAALAASCDLSDDHLEFVNPVADVLDLRVGHGEAVVVGDMRGDPSGVALPPSGDFALVLGHLPIELQIDVVELVLRLRVGNRLAGKLQFLRRRTQVDLRLGDSRMRVLVFLAGRLEARDQRKMLLQEAEILGKLKEGTEEHSAMSAEVLKSIGRYSADQNARRENRYENSMMRAFGVVFALFFIMILVKQTFRFRQNYEDLLTTLTQTCGSTLVALLLFILAPRISSIWRDIRASRKKHLAPSTD